MIINRRDMCTLVVLLLLGAFTLSCTSSSSTQPVPLIEEPLLSAEEPVLANNETVPIIWDDDGSIDGVTALLYLLQHPSYGVKAATISPGIAHPAISSPSFLISP